MNTMNTLSNHIIAVAHNRNVLITNLQLQKVLYFSFMYANKRHIFNRKELKEIYNSSNDKFQVWRYGPVIKNIYEFFSIYNANPIMWLGKISKFFNKHKFNSYIIKLLKQNPFDLVDQSHEEDFWSRNCNKINGWRSNVTYSFNDVISGKEYEFN